MLSGEVEASVYLIHVADCPPICDRKLNRNVRPPEMAPTPRSVRRWPVIVQPVIICQLILVPRVYASNHALGGIRPASTQVIDVPGVEIVRRVDFLLPDWNAVIYLNVGVREAANPGHCPKIMVECSILCILGYLLKKSAFLGSVLPCINNTTCSMSAREPTPTDSKIGYMKAMTKKDPLPNDAKASLPDSYRLFGCV